MKPQALRFALLLSVVCGMTSCGHDAAPADAARRAPVSGAVSRHQATATRAAAPGDASSIDAQIPASGPDTHCSAQEETIFSCRLEGSDRVVSLCVKSENAESGTGVRYASGPLRKPDVTYPDMAPVSGSPAFERTPLTYAGGTGGYAYSIDQEGQTRILYSISGDDHIERQGEMTTNTDASEALSDHPCRPDRVTESDDMDVLRLVRRWPARPALERHGLPSAAP
jgi:hypothetical protein